VETWQILVLAVVQGIAEFLPISSSGHLVIVSALLGNRSPADVADVNIVLHMGTLTSILVFYWREIKRLLSVDRRVIPLLVVGTIPVAIIGLIVKARFEEILASTPLAGCMLVVTGVMLMWAARHKQGTDEYQKLSALEALRIGCAQAFALLPGISRSGTTIAAGLKVGLTRYDAATFSFLLAIPAIGGASVLEIADIAAGTPLNTSLFDLIAGALVAFVVGLFSLWWLIEWLRRGRLELFGYWCLAVGLAVIIWQFASSFNG
jgi:undecaprenyl-diphosphatase